MIINTLFGTLKICKNIFEKGENLFNITYIVNFKNILF